MLESVPNKSSSFGSSYASTAPYKQAVLTYFRRAMAMTLAQSLGVVAGLLYTVLVIPRFQIENAPKTAQFVWLAVIVFMTWPIFFNHVGNQFADPRARLVPGFRHAHARAAGGMALALIAMFTILGMIQGLKFETALVLVSSCAGTHALLLNVPKKARYAAIMVVLACPYILVASQFRLLSQWWATCPPYAVGGLLILGVLCIAWQIVRLGELTEDDPAYAEFQKVGVQKGRGSREEYSGSIWTLFRKDGTNQREVARAIRHAQQARGSAWSRVQRWNNGLQVEVGFTVLVCLLWAYYELYSWSTMKSEIRSLSSG